MPQDSSSLLAPEDLDLPSLAVHLLVALVLSIILGWHFMRFAPVMGAKHKLARVFVWIATTTLLIISVVKVSLALSLGLVGALSIIRFRTPIKEPEELAYLFVAVAIGVGLGAERLWETATVVAIVLTYMALRSDGPAQSSLRTILHVTIPDMQRHTPLAQVVALAQTHCDAVDLRRADRIDGEFQASLFVTLRTTDSLQKLLDEVAATWPSATVSVVERGTTE